MHIMCPQPFPPLPYTLMLCYARMHSRSSPITKSLSLSTQCQGLGSPTRRKRKHCAVTEGMIETALVRCASTGSLFLCGYCSVHCETHVTTHHTEESEHDLQLDSRWHRGDASKIAHNARLLPCA